MERPRRPARQSASSMEENNYVDISESTEVLDYETDIKIDPDNVDVEFLNHADLFMKYSKESARLNANAKLAEERVKTIRTRLIKEAKETGVKITESTLETVYRLNPEYIEAKKIAIQAQYEADLGLVAVFAFQARKTSLENLVKLIGMQYCANPQEPRDLPEAAKRFEEMREQKTENIIRSRTNSKRR